MHYKLFSFLTNFLVTTLQNKLYICSVNYIKKMNYERVD